MKIQSTLQRTLQALFITGISTFALAPALAVDTVEVTATSIHAQGTTENKSVGENTLTETQQSATPKLTIRPIRTDSPRKTLKSFLRLRDELEQTLHSYRLDKSRELYEHMDVTYDQLLALLDLSLVPPASRREIGIDTIAYLLDILGRVELPDIDSVPGEEAFEDDAVTREMAHPRHTNQNCPTSTRGRERENFCSVSARLKLRRDSTGVLKICLCRRLCPSLAGIVLFPRSPDR